MKISELLDKQINEEGSDGATVAGAVASSTPFVANKRGKTKKNRDGTAKNALDYNVSLFGKQTAKR
jgi:hypothetical protein